MNLFALSGSAAKAAAYHCDKHLVKMILETCQLLYTAWAVVGTRRFAPELRIDQEVDVTQEGAVSVHRNPISVSWRRRSMAGSHRVASVKRDADGQLVFSLSDGGAFQEPSLAAYKPTHRNHPTAKWVQARPENYRWACELGLALCAVYTEVYGRTHKCETHLRCLASMDFPGAKVSEPGRKVATADVPHGCADFYVAIADDVFDRVARYTDDGRLKAVETYREYYKVKPFAMTWKDRDRPVWFGERAARAM